MGKIKTIIWNLLFAFKVGCFLTEFDHETNLQNEMFRLYNPDVHPCTNTTNGSNCVIVVTFDVQVIRIMNVNERQQYLEAYMWINQYWVNPLLAWNPGDYGGVENIHVKPEKVWVPDIVLYNSIEEDSEQGEELYKSKVSVSKDGRCTWLNPVTLKTICSVDVSFFPFDDQTCHFKFGSWAYDSSKIDMLPPRSISTKNDYYIPNGEWHLQNIKATRNELLYQCCPNAFVDVTISIKLSRQALNYTFNYIIPAALLSSLVLLGFVLPPESGERVGLSITVLLSVTVFQQLSSAIMPSYDFPYLAQYYFATMMQTAFSLFATTIVLNFYHRSNRKMPAILRKILLQWLSKLLFCGKTMKYDSMESFHESPSPSDVESHCKQFASANSSPLPEHTSPSRPTVFFRRYCRHVKDDNSHSNGFLKRKRTLVTRQGSGRNHVSKALTNAIDSTVLPLLDEKAARKAKTDIDKARSEKIKHERQKEWIRGARVLDRFFMALFIIMSITSLLTIFMRAPRFRI